MRNTEERLVLLHQRAAALKRKRDRALLHACGLATSALTAGLFFLLSLFTSRGHGITQTGYAASSMLSDNAGGYVLVAVITFAAGVLITLGMQRARRRDEEQQKKDGT